MMNRLSGACPAFRPTQRHSHDSSSLMTIRPPNGDNLSYWFDG